MRVPEPTPCAAILAAGLGRRLGGRPKAALLLDGRSLLERLADGLREAGLTHISVVLGPYREQLTPLAARAGLTVIAHTLDEPSLMDSQRLAIREHLQAHPEVPLCLLPADLPWLQAADLHPLRQAWAQRPPGIEALRPTVQGQPGHPVLLSPAALRAIDTQPPNQGVRHWLQAHPALLLGLPMDSPGPVRDLDTEADVQALRAARLCADVGWALPDPHQG